MLRGVLAKRLAGERKRLEHEQTPGIQLFLIDECNLQQWRAIIEGPEGSPYEGGNFELSLRIPDDYPNSPPKATFVTRIFHPNVFTNGNICLDTLQNNWSPAMDLSQLCLSIQSLLTDPNPNDPANGKAGDLYNRNPNAYGEKVRRYVKKFAMGSR